MSDPAEHPAGDRASRPDADAWATACEEDLASEKARRRAEYGRPPTNAAEELRRLADAVSEKIAEFGKPLGGAAAAATAQGVAQQMVAQAKAAIEPVVERNPQVFDHLAAAGGELLAAYRAAVQDAEQKWTADRPHSGGPGNTQGDAAPGNDAGERGSGARPGAERIDLDPDDGTGAGGQGGKRESGKDEGGNGEGDGGGSGAGNA